MKLAVCIPSRGLIHSRTIEAVLNQSTTVPDETKLFFAHGLPIPDCFNNLIEQARDWGATHVWFVEEDNVPNHHTLAQLIHAIRGEKADVAVSDYPLLGGVSAVNDYNGIKVVGTGCMLVPMKVLEAVGLFKAVGHWVREGKLVPFKEYGPADNERIYGQHDIYFSKQLQDKGYTIKVVDTIGHLKIRNWGKQGVNSGAHDIYDLTEELPNGSS